ncbi:hypothetical protein BASA50_007520 [Batrachochytrium salamandrivorans]|uniref:Ribosomal protein S21 n=1 Tax=Batrachochytrium salamandrivorans TaxID=1357716 RepID=A0ABQ8F717_9FUNG|nr:hypothetical protein BASA62_008580 [Batrachochytrium salamandrivorans]KAH6575638.1 hypothetical protein BASA60_004942 [Batrachochytrium salamandrivorans]KAH6593312.1 hypothetical protein BASA50_007520 [Batrachochytrium salamandrivorans]KAH6595591.1 hypothetical protein BASA61_003782 [Batrachochytrium salamandrivorans]KAH9274215.1 hypothetical protein BASA83_003523 [Batrachochytrium salamandrivorans]
MLGVGATTSSWALSVGGRLMSAMPRTYISLFRSPVCIAHSNRGFKQHMNETFTHSAGRSVVVKGSSSMSAYFYLRKVLNESNFRSLVKGQERFESNPDKRRRKRKERDWAIYMLEVRRQSRQAMDLARRTQQEKNQYRDI